MYAPFFLQLLCFFLYFSIFENRFLFGSEPKAILAYPNKKPVVNRYGLCEILGLGPARSPGCGVYEGICEIQPGYAAYRGAFSP